jgi:[ribosomal protein S5]-alanine N-acetyltransferase
MNPTKITLNKITESDLTDRVMDWFQDEELMRYYTNSKKIITKSTLLDHLKKGQEDATSFTYGIFDCSNGKMLGTIKLGPINHNHRISDLVVLIGDREYHGKGLAIDAIQLGCEIAFNDFDIRKLFGGMYASNVNSVKSYLRAGWVIEGILKGHYYNNNKNEDRIEVGCFNPKYFTKEEIESATFMNLETYLLRYLK